MSENLEIYREWYNKGLELINNYFNVKSEVFKYLSLEPPLYDYYDLKKKLNRFLFLKFISSYHNIPDSADNLFLQSSDFDYLLNHFQCNYLSQIDIIALKNLIKDFYPLISSLTLKSTFPHLTLRVKYIYKYRPYRKTLDDKFLSAVKSFLVFLDVLVNNAAPSKTTCNIDLFSSSDPSLILAFKKYSQDYIDKNILFFERHLDYCGLASYKFYKNGNWVLKFKDRKIFNQLSIALSNIFYHFRDFNKFSTLTI